MNTRKIITFYSYKGGVGRTFVLANTAVLLARWGYRVLCMDWDLEAPGLSNYFASSQTAPIESGLLDWLEKSGNDHHSWQQHIVPLEVSPKPGSSWQKAVDLDFLPVGRQDDHYISRLQGLDWTKLYEVHHLGERLERLRDELLLAYDFVLIDSRTGISDSGGICTIQIPDVLVFLFTANDQSLNGVTDAVRRAKASQKNLPHDRAPLLTLPVLSRFDATVEHQLGQQWLTKIVNALPEFYTQWVEAPPLSESETPPDPKSLVDTPRLLSLCTLPYVPFWSFGEELAVTSENTAFTQNISHHIETLAALLAHRLTKSSLLLESRQKYVETAARVDAETSAFTFQAFVASDFRTSREAIALAKHLNEQGISTWHDSFHSKSSESGLTLLQTALRQSRHFVILAGPAAAHDRTLVQLTQQMARELVDHPGDRRLVSIVKEGPTPVLPLMLRDRTMFFVPTFEPDVVGVVLKQKLDLSDEANRASENTPSISTLDAWLGIGGSRRDVIVPELGESVAGGQISKWHFKTGDTVKLGDVLLTLETDKVAAEITAEAAGVLSIKKEAGEDVEVGTVVGNIIETAQEDLEVPTWMRLKRKSRR